MNVAYATDENYAVHAYVSINSLLDSNLDEKEICIYVIENKLNDETKMHFNDLVNGYHTDKTTRKLSFISYAPFADQIVKAYNDNETRNVSTYGRIFLAAMNDIDRILYIDCDTVVLGALQDLYNTSLRGIGVAGVQDVVSLETRKKVGMEYGDRYFNAGVSLLNLNYWRENDAINQCLDYIKHYGGKVPFEDQGVMNSVFKNNSSIIHPKYNVMNFMLFYNAKQISVFYDVENYYNNTEIVQAIQDPRIIHYTAGPFIRPWFSDSNHPYAQIYRKYRSLSPWSNVPLNANLKNESFINKINIMIRKNIPLPVYIGLRKIKRQLNTK